MKIVAGFLRSSQGRAALDRAIEEAKLRNASLLVVHSMRGGERDEMEQVLTYREELEKVERQLTESGIDFEIKDYVRGQTPAEDLLEAAREEGAGLIVIGIRRRSPVGKLLMGSNAQDILLKADCAVLAVKPDEDD